MNRYWLAALVVIALVGALILVGQPDNQPVSTDDINPPAPCFASDGVMACGEAVCEGDKGGAFTCPDNRECDLLSSGLDVPTIMCQQAPGPAQAKEDGDEETTVREPDLAPPDEELSGGDINAQCSAGVIAKVRLRRNGGLIESHNLAHGFEEVVIPFGYGANLEFRPGPDWTFPYPGELTGEWRLTAPRSLLLARGVKSKTETDLIAGWTLNPRGRISVPDAQRPQVHTHTITAVWDPEGDKPPCNMPPHSFRLTWARQIPNAPTLNLRSFIDSARQGGFGLPPGEPSRTRVFHDSPKSRDENVLLPLGILWVTNPNCCNIANAQKKVIQFARAAIHGPNGRQAKRWTLDMKASELNDVPEHDPTYTSNPNNDNPEAPTPNGGGGTAPEGNDLLQWDAPGMPKSLYDRLAAAQAASTYRQQFLSLLVCRPPGSGPDRHEAAFYLTNAGVRHVLVSTVRWNFPGSYGNPTITVTYDQRDGGCTSLSDFLRVNNLTDEYSNPTSEARKLEILPRRKYRELVRDVVAWEDRPFDHVQFP